MSLVKLDLTDVFGILVSEQLRFNTFQPEELKGYGTWGCFQYFTDNYLGLYKKWQNSSAQNDSRVLIPQIPKQVEDKKDKKYSKGKDKSYSNKSKGKDKSYSNKSKGKNNSKGTGKSKSKKWSPHP